VGLSKVLKFGAHFVERPCGICGGESGTGQVCKVESSLSCSAASHCIGGVECVGFCCQVCGLLMALVEEYVRFLVVFT
jgi:hypothetical protein